VPATSAVVGSLLSIHLVPNSATSPIIKAGFETDLATVEDITLVPACLAVYYIMVSVVFLAT
jgi:hypothetical protein